jgi:hypothetical protein
MRQMLRRYDTDEVWGETGGTALPQAMEQAVGLAHQLNANGQYVITAPRGRDSNPLVSGFARE